MLQGVFIMIELEQLMVYKLYRRNNASYLHRCDTYWIIMSFNIILIIEIQLYK